MTQTKGIVSPQEILCSISTVYLHCMHVIYCQNCDNLLCINFTEQHVKIQSILFSAVYKISVFHTLYFIQSTLYSVFL